MSEGKSDAPLMVGVSGLRGIVGESLNDSVLDNFAGASAAWYLDEIADMPGATPPVVIVGRDGRKGGEVIQQRVIQRLTESRFEVINAEVAMTPSLGVVADLKRGFAVQITASHNPSEWNGVKLIVRATGSSDSIDAAAPTRQQSTAVEIRFRAAMNSSSSGDAANGGVETQVLSSLEVARIHVNKVVEALRAASISSAVDAICAVDSVNCSGGLAAAELFEKLGCKAHQLHGDNSGIFPHTPEPTAENLSGEGGLCDAVPGLKADIGFAQDPDGDRLAIVDETGRYIGEEYTLALCAMSILEAHRNAPPSPKGELSAQPTEGVSSRSKGTPSDPADAGPFPPSATGEDVVLCANLSTSRMVDDIAATYGASVVRTAVGEANVVEAMKRLKREGKTVVLGGEGNGGVIWPEVTYVRDSLGSMALVLSLMARTGKTVSELVADIPSYSIVKRKQPLAQKADAQPAIERIASAYALERVDIQDGVRVDFDDYLEQGKAWVHVRASNTEPILRLIAEAETEAASHSLLDEIAKLVQE